VIWVGWRQQRWETIVAAAILAAIAALLVPTGLSMFSAYNNDGLASCAGALQSGVCDSAARQFTNEFTGLGNLIAWFTLVPGLIGILLAAPFVADLERGTYRLDWTQSITRRRWIVGKLGVGFLTAVVAALAFIALVTWWRTPLVRVQGRMDNSVFDSEGIVAIGYALFALGLAAAIGAIWRRTVPALVSAFALYFAARLFVDTWLRQRLVTPLHATWAVSGRGPNLDKAWIVSQFPSDQHGHAVAFAGLTCAKGANCAAPVPAKAATHYFHAIYHPASHFWPLQSVEFAIFAGAAALLLGLAALWTTRRIA
jgi:ABC-type transport system involved in multi-copper enzyme maturation permease subunit